MVFLGKLNDFLVRFHIYDLILDVVILICALITRYSKIENNNNSNFVISDTDQQLSTQTMSYELVCVVTFLIGSIVVISLWASKHFDVSILNCFFSYLFAIFMTMLVTSVISKSVLRAKPDTQEVCNTVSPSIEECYKVLTPKLVTEQFSSFPCYQAAEATACAVYISLLMSYVTPGFSAFTMLMQIAPIFFALFVSSSAIWDRQSHIDDVVVGILIGAIISFLSFTTFKKGTKHISLVKKLQAAQIDTSALIVPKYV